MKEEKSLSFSRSQFMFALSNFDELFCAFCELFVVAAH
jgi:hypothetical protein